MVEIEIRQNFSRWTVQEAKNKKALKYQPQQEGYD